MGPETKRRFGASNVEAATRLSVRPARVPLDLAAETAQIRDLPRKVANRDFETATDVHRIRRVVFLGGERDGLGAIIDIQKLASRGAVTPERHAPPARIRSVGDINATYQTSESCLTFSTLRGRPLAATFAAVTLLSDLDAFYLEHRRCGAAPRFRV